MCTLKERRNALGAAGRETGRDWERKREGKREGNETEKEIKRKEKERETERGRLREEERERGRERSNAQRGFGEVGEAARRLDGDGHIWQTKNKETSLSPTSEKRRNQENKPNSKI